MYKSCIFIATQLLTYHEGVSLEVYTDSKGYATWGVGRCLELRNVSPVESIYVFSHLHEPCAIANYLLKNDIRDIISSLENYRFWENLDDIRKAAVIDFAFNLGATKFALWRRFIECMDNQDYSGAASELKLNSSGKGVSDWWGDVGRRAPNIYKIVKFGTIPDHLEKVVRIPKV